MRTYEVMDGNGQRFRLDADKIREQRGGQFCFLRTVRKDDTSDVIRREVVAIFDNPAYIREFTSPCAHPDTEKTTTDKRPIVECCDGSRWRLVRTGSPKAGEQYLLPECVLPVMAGTDFAMLEYPILERITP